MATYYDDVEFTIPLAGLDHRWLDWVCPGCGGRIQIAEAHKPTFYRNTEQIVMRFLGLCQKMCPFYGQIVLSLGSSWEHILAGSLFQLLTPCWSRPDDIWECSYTLDSNDVWVFNGGPKWRPSAIRSKGFDILA